MNVLRRNLLSGTSIWVVIACALLAATTLLIPRQAHASNGQCIWEGGPGASQYSECKLEDCLGMGGMAQCMDPVIRASPGQSDASVDGEKYHYIFGDAQELDSGLFCMGLGGTWNGLYGNPACANLPSGYQSFQDANSESLALQGAQAGMNYKFGVTYNPGTNTGGCGGAQLLSDTGWGQPPSSSQNGIEVGSSRNQVYMAVDAACSPGGITVSFLRYRSLQCPPAFGTRTLPNGYLQCVIPSSGCVYCDGVGNPVSPVTGGKLEARVDYQAGGAGGIAFGHYYNSVGQFRPPGSGPFAAGFSDYWHFSYDRHLTQIPGYAQLTAALHREDGSVEWFDGSGNEILNRTGAADRLVSVAGGGWTLTLANSDVERYDASGNLTSITTRAGIVTAVSYGGNGKMSQVADSFGHVLSMSYDPVSNQLTTVTLPDGSNTISYQYGNLGQLTTITYADQTTLTYEYEDPNSSWLLTGITDESNQRYATYVYSPQGIVSHEEHAGGADAYDFNFSGICNTNQTCAYVTDPLGQTRSYFFSSQNGVSKLTSSTPYCSGCPNTISASYDANGNSQSVTDLNYNQTTYVYDQVRNLETSRTEGLGQSGATTSSTRTKTTQWHPTLRLPAQITVYSGPSATGTPVQTTAYTYDGYGNVLTRMLTDGATGASRTWTNTYYNSGLYAQVETADGPRSDVTDVTTYTYYNCTSGAQCGQVHTVTDALGHVTTYNSYDANGLPLSITDQNGTVTLLTYDLRQRIKTSTVGGEQTRYDYYPTGLVQKVTRPDSSYLSYIYDAAHRLIEVDDALGDRLVYTLDAAGNQRQVQRYDPSGTLARAQSAIYNSLGQLWQQLTSSADSSQATVYGYDSTGNATSVQAPLARNTGNLYDELNRLKQTTDPAGGNTLFGYDALDNLVSVTDPRTLHTSYTYNGLGDLRSVVSPDTGTTQSSFDSGGNVSLHTDARGAAATYTYDALNRPTHVAYSDQSFGFTYDQGTNAVGRLSKITDGSGQTTYGYDPLGRIVQKQQTTGGVALAVGYTYQNAQLTTLTMPSGQTLSYAYDASGHVSSINVNGVGILGSVQYSPYGPVTGWTWGNGTQTTRSYDIDGRLTGVASAGTSTYTFYDDGSISSRSDDTEHDYSVVAGSTTLAVSATSNQLTNATGVLTRTYSYDQAGNTSGTGTLVYGYNGAGRLTSAQAGTTTTTFAVNALGQRVSKTSTAGTTLFAYDEAAHLIGEYTATGSLVQETVWLGDTPVATLRPNSTGTTDIYYAHTDHLDTPRRISRATDNAIVWRWSSDPFGNGFVDEDPDGDGQLFVYNPRFPGQYFDAETGLHYNYYRDYDPATGRYVESDPIGLDGGSMSTYSYVNDDPLDYIDPEGLAGAPRRRVRDCNSDEMTQCQAQCAGKGVRSCKRQQLFQPVRTTNRNGTVLTNWIWKDQGLSCDCKDPEACKNAIKNAAAALGLSVTTYLIISEGSRLFPPRNLLPVP